MVAILSRGRWINTQSANHVWATAPIVICSWVVLETVEIFWDVDSSPPGQNDHHFADDISDAFLVHVKFCILIKISLKFVPKSPIYNKLALV